MHEKHGDAPLAKVLGRARGALEAMHAFLGQFAGAPTGALRTLAAAKKTQAQFAEHFAELDAIKKDLQLAITSEMSAELRKNSANQSRMIRRQQSQKGRELQILSHVEQRSLKDEAQHRRVTSADAVKIAYEDLKYLDETPPVRTISRSTFTHWSREWGGTVGTRTGTLSSLRSDISAFVAGAPESKGTR